MLHPLIRFSVFLGAITFFCSVNVAQADQPKPFFHNSLDELEMTYAGKPFLLSVWSIECGPCFKELDVLSKLKEEYPGFNLILLSADSVGVMGEVEQFLTEYNLSEVNSWMYGSNRTEQLRYAIDPAWYGEMPRSYFYDKDGKRKAVSGLLSEDVLRRWIASTMDSAS